MHEGLDRRNFLATTSAFAALLASGCTARGAGPTPPPAPGDFVGYGPLIKDPAGILDLPEGFSYRIISKLGGAMSDGGTVPDKADGMGCFNLGNGEIALVRNHELMPSDDAGGTPAYGYDMAAGSKVLPGGTTTIVLDAETLAVKQQFRSLAGTIRNCSGGKTAWRTWLTCEEFVSEDKHLGPDKLGKSHGWVFEVPAVGRGLMQPEPLKHLGRFNHEAAVVDPASGYVYMTEDRDDSLIYRFVPSVMSRLSEPGRLQALAIEGVPDARNWKGDKLATGAWKGVRWIDLEDTDAPLDDLRKRGAAAGATLFARGEGMHMGKGEVYFCCTSGGAKKLGQIFRLQPGTPTMERVQLFFESTDPAQFNYGDNLAVAPNGHLVICEDQYTAVVDNHIRGITPKGQPYTIARLTMQTELAGGCFSPDGKTMFVNVYAPAHTLAITGPWLPA